MYFVHILQSLRFPRQYIGSADIVQVRLRKHNAGSVRSTKAYKPWKLVKVEKFTTKREARQREMQLKKSGRLRKELKQLANK